MPALLDLVAEVLEARTRTPSADPALIPLEESPDPGITSVPEAQLREFEGQWRYPPAVLGLPQETTVEIRVGEGHLVSFVPVAGTFRLYLQPDGSFHSEDSHVRYVPIRDDAGVLAGIAEVESVLASALTSAADGDSGGAVRWLNTVEGLGGSQGAAAAAVVDLLLGREGQAESQVRQLAEEGVPENVEADINAMGSFLIQSDRASKALQVFEFDTRFFPRAFRAWDGLGRAHMALEQNDAALRAFERSLELNPDNANARRMIQRIRGG
jgi:tetratricopeptide (TPR) repeat protein